MKGIDTAMILTALLALVAMAGCQPADSQTVALSGNGLAMHLTSPVRYDAAAGKATVEVVMVNYGPDPILVDTDLHVSGHGEIPGPEIGAFGGGGGISMFPRPPYCLLQPSPPAEDAKGICYCGAGHTFRKTVSFAASAAITDERYARTIEVFTATLRVTQDGETGQWMVARQAASLKAVISSVDVN